MPKKKAVPNKPVARINHKPKKRDTRTVVRDSGVAVALIAAISSGITTWLQVHQTSIDLKDSFAIDSKKISKLTFEVGKLEGKLSALEPSLRGEESQSMYSVIPEPQSVIDLGEITIIGKISDGGLDAGVEDLETALKHYRGEDK